MGLGGGVGLGVWGFGGLVASVFGVWGFRLQVFGLFFGVFRV